MNILEILNLLEPITPQQRKEVLFKMGNLKDFQDRAFECDFFGYIYKGHTRNLIDKHVYLLGCYEKGLLNYIAHLLENSIHKIFVDIGANNGHHSLYLSRFAQKVFSFEPYDLVRTLMEDQLARNSIQNVVVYPFALGNENTEIPFYPPTDINLGTGSFLENFEPTNSNETMLLKTFHGTELFEKLKIDQVDVIKIDVEGFEYFVLEGLINFLKQKLPIIIFEYSHVNHDLFNQQNKVMNFLIENYKLQVIRNPNCPDIILKPWTGCDYGNVLCTPLSRISNET